MMIEAENDPGELVPVEKGEAKEGRGGSRIPCGDAKAEVRGKEQELPRIAAGLGCHGRKSTMICGMDDRTSALAEAIGIMARLRGPGGCPWDREQTFDTIKRHTLEETYEVFDAIERKAWPELKDELGDLLLQVLFYAQMAEEAGYFSIEDVAAGLNAKLIRRHPHIFGDGKAETAAEVNATWEAVKRAEKGDVAPGRLLDAVPRHVPALLEAEKRGGEGCEGWI